MLNQPGIVGDGVLETKVPHSHSRHHSRSVDSWRRLSVVLGLTTLYMIAEVLGGWWTGSLALLADAGHMFTDAAALILALTAVWFASRPATSKKNFRILPTRDHCRVGKRRCPGRNCTVD